MDSALSGPPHNVEKGAQEKAENANNARVARHNMGGICGRCGPLHLPVHTEHHGIAVHRNTRLAKCMGDVTDRKRLYPKGTNNPLSHVGSSVPRGRGGVHEPSRP